MNAFLIVAIAGIAMVAVAVLFLLRHSRATVTTGTYASLPKDREPVDPLLHSQLAASLSEGPRKSDNPLDE